MSTTVRLASSQRPLGRWLQPTPQGGLDGDDVERPAGLDVHKAQVTACVRTASPDGGRDEHVAEFATTVAVMNRNIVVRSGPTDA